MMQYMGNMLDNNIMSTYKNVTLMGNVKNNEASLKHYLGITHSVLIEKNEVKSSYIGEDHICKKFSPAM